MTITVHGPNGITIDFPEGTDAGTINSVMTQAVGGKPSTAPAPDKYQQAAIEERDRLVAKGISRPAGLTERLFQGATLGAGDEIIAGLSTPLEMIKRGTFDPTEGYAYAKAREDLRNEDARKNTGWLGTAAEIAGGGLSGAGLAKAGVTAGRFLAPEAGILKRAAASALDATALGGFSGAMEGNGLSERLQNAGKGALVGGLVGGTLPIAGAIAKGIAAPVIANIRARANPEGYATSQVARAVSESGRAPTDIGREIADANAAGQPFTLADALGNSGQRMLSTVARAPGKGRTDVTEFLQARQAGQGERVSQIIDEALGSGGSARQTTAALTKQAQTESAPFYEKSLAQKPVWSERMQQFFDDPVTRKGLREGVEVQRLEALAEGRKFDPLDYAIKGFNEAGDPIISGVPNMRTINLVKKGWDNILEQYRDKTTGRLVLDERGRALDAVRRSFLKEVDSINPDYAKARSLYAGPSQIRDAVTAGGDAAARGRAVDNLGRFSSLTEPSKQGFRIGYADKLVGDIEHAAMGADKVRPLTSQKRQAELTAQSLYQGPVQPGKLDPLQQRLSRENAMFETRRQALGNSKTAENLADDAAMGVDPGLIKSVVTGDIMGAVRHALSAGQNAMTGNTAQVREAVGRLLLQRGTNPDQINRMVGETMRRLRQVQDITRNLGRGALGGIAVATPSMQQRRQ